MKQFTIINSIEELDEAIDGADGVLECGISLAGGAVYSKKTISKDIKGRYRVENHIDGSKQILTADELFDHDLTNVGQAIEKGALFVIEE